VVVVTSLDRRPSGPSHSRATVVAGSMMTAEVQRLQTKAVVLSSCNGPMVVAVRAADVAYELHRQLLTSRRTF
jgi:hypothetical protein